MTAPIKLGQTHKNKTHHWKEQAKISQWTNCQSHTTKYREAPSFWNFEFYKVMYGEWSNLARSVHLPYRNLQKQNFPTDGRCFGIIWSLTPKIASLTHKTTRSQRGANNTDVMK